MQPKMFGHAAASMTDKILALDNDETIRNTHNFNKLSSKGELMSIRLNMRCLRGLESCSAQRQHDKNYLKVTSRKTLPKSS